MITVNLDDIYHEFRFEVQNYDYDQNSLIYSNIATTFHAETMFDECLERNNVVHIDYNHYFNIPYSIRYGQCERHGDCTYTIYLSKEMGMNGKNSTLLHELSHAIIRNKNYIIASNIVEHVCDIIPYVIGKIFDIPEMSNFALLSHLRKYRNAVKVLDGFTYGYAHIEKIVNELLASVID